MEFVSLVSILFTLPTKLYKTILFKYYLQHKTTILSSIAHCFFIILTAEMVNDINDTHRKKPKLAIKESKSLPLSKIIDNPLDESSHSDDPTKTPNNSNDIISTPPFYIERQCD